MARLSIDDLFAIIPEEYRVTERPEDPRQMGESEIVDHFKGCCGGRMPTGYASFLGAGVYRHYRPVIIDTIVQRGEFLIFVHAISGGDYAGDAAGDFRISDDDLRTDGDGHRERVNVRRANGGA